MPALIAYISIYLLRKQLKNNKSGYGHYGQKLCLPSFHPASYLYPIPYFYPAPYLHTHRHSHHVKINNPQLKVVYIQIGGLFGFFIYTSMHLLVKQL